MGTHFLMAFQVVDVCFAHRNWNCASIKNTFCGKLTPSRLCRYAYEIRVTEPTTLFATALQPTKRGAWCRDDRKRSYRPGDLSLILVRLQSVADSEEPRSLDVVVNGIFCGATSK